MMYRVETNVTMTTDVGMKYFCDESDYRRPHWIPVDKHRNGRNTSEIFGRDVGYIQEVYRRNLY